MKLRNTANKQQPSIAMREYDGVAYVDMNEAPSSPKLDNFKKVSVLHLIFLIFYEVSGGPFGMEDSVQAAGPLLALLGFLVFPLIWSVPEALITAEMGTMFPENGGYVVWVSTALGPYWGFQQGWMKWLSGVIDNALYPVLFLDYLKSGIPGLAGGLPRAAAALALTFLLTYMNYKGLVIVGRVAVLLGIFSILPFVVMGLVAIPKLEPARWFVMNLHDVDWSLYLNTLFWNLNYWDSVSTLAGEVDNPKKNLPKALFYALILVVLSYFLPLLAGTGAIPLNRDLWTDGYFSDIAKILGGVWLRWWIQGAAAMSNMGMFVAEMSSDSFQLLGMAERGMLPEFFAKRSRHGTPLIGIFIFCIWCYFVIMAKLSGDHSCREFSLLLWNDIGIYSICIAKDKMSCCFTALQDSCGNTWSHSYVYSSNHTDLCCSSSFNSQSDDCEPVCSGSWPCDATLSQIC
ncbi:hypothetical protein OIU78_014004 [Salix suchowensis]|nr:hypothetical protein OIU78_014004 [Salix suchowensis]